MPASRRPRVLCADDNEENRVLVESTLETEGVDLVSVASGDAAIAAFAAEPADLLLLDVRMPGKDGFATLAAIRSLPGGADVPAIFLTALRDLDTFDRAQASGAADFLTKPIRPAELAARVHTLVQLRRLGDEVKRHHEEIRRQRDALMRAQLQRERLAAFVVHDLKSPLGAVKMHASLLLRDKALTGDARESARTISELSDRLGQLVLNLLDLAKADEGQLEPRRAPVPLAPLARGVEHALEGPARDRRLRIAAAVADEIVALGDGDLLRRVLENLVDNALRHAPAETTVSIEAVRDAEGVEIRVRDEGAGVPEHLRDRIFDRFVQLEAGAASSRSGRGLGLSFCKSAVEVQGGTIRVGEGTGGAVFVIRLPAPADDG